MKKYLLIIYRNIPLKVYHPAIAHMITRCVLWIMLRAILTFFFEFLTHESTKMVRVTESVNTLV